MNTDTNTLNNALIAAGTALQHLGLVLTQIGTVGAQTPAKYDYTSVEGDRGKRTPAKISVPTVQPKPSPEEKKKKKKKRANRRYRHRVTTGMVVPQKRAKVAEASDFCTVSVAKSCFSPK